VTTREVNATINWVCLENLKVHDWSNENEETSPADKEQKMVDAARLNL